MHTNDEPFYNASLPYGENYRFGPFGAFTGNPLITPANTNTATFMGFAVTHPFGIPAGPLLNGRFVRASWAWGFPIATYKTVRGNAYPCHPFPNIVRLASTGMVRPGATLVGDTDMRSIDVTVDGITNSFGVPSMEPDVWQKDVMETVRATPQGNVLVLSFMGTKTEGMTPEAYVGDFVRTCRLAAQTGAPILEVNFSCPNVGKEGLICNDVVTSGNILEALAAEKGNVPLLVKIGYIPQSADAELSRLLSLVARFADGVVAINTIQATVTDGAGKQLLPGSPVRLQSGVCGASIAWAGLEMAGRIMEWKRMNGAKDMAVVGVGGITTPDDYRRYMDLGVDACQSATGAMWKPSLALDILAAGR